jgi:hypothetical protein
MEYLEIMATIAAGGGTITSISIFLGKSYFDKKMKNLADKEDQRKISFEAEMGKIEATKQSVEEMTRKIEDVKKDFDINKITYQIQFSKLHDRRMIAVETMYEKLFRLQNATQVITRILHPIINDAEAEAKARLNEAQNAYNDFRNYFPGKMILFSDEINEMLFNIVKLFWDCLWDSTELQRLRQVGVSGPELKSGFDKAEAARESFNTEIPKAISAMDKEFKKLLGITNN